MCEFVCTSVWTIISWKSSDCNESSVLFWTNIWTKSISNHNLESYTHSSSLFGLNDCIKWEKEKHSERKQKWWNPQTKFKWNPEKKPLKNIETPCHEQIRPICNEKYIYVYAIAIGIFYIMCIEVYAVLVSICMNEYFRGISIKEPKGNQKVVSFLKRTQ